MAGVQMSSPQLGHPFNPPSSQTTPAGPARKPSALFDSLMLSEPPTPAVASDTRSASPAVSIASTANPTQRPSDDGKTPSRLPPPPPPASRKKASSALIRTQPGPTNGATAASATAGAGAPATATSRSSAASSQAWSEGAPEYQRLDTTLQLESLLDRQEENFTSTRQLAGRGKRKRESGRKSPSLAATSPTLTANTATGGRGGRSASTSTSTSTSARRRKSSRYSDGGQSAAGGDAGAGGAVLSSEDVAAQHALASLREMLGEIHTVTLRRSSAQIALGFLVKEVRVGNIDTLQVAALTPGGIADSTEMIHVEQVLVCVNGQPFAALTDLAAWLQRKKTLTVEVAAVKPQIPVQDKPEHKSPALARRKDMLHHPRAEAQEALEAPPPSPTALRALNHVYDSPSITKAELGAALAALSLPSCPEEEEEEEEAETAAQAGVNGAAAEEEEDVYGEAHPILQHAVEAPTTAPSVATDDAGRDAAREAHAATPIHIDNGSQQSGEEEAAVAAEGEEAGGSQSQCEPEANSEAPAEPTAPPTKQESIYASHGEPSESASDNNNSSSSNNDARSPGWALHRLLSGVEAPSDGDSDMPQSALSESTDARPLDEGGRSPGPRSSGSARSRSRDRYRGFKAAGSGGSAADDEGEPEEEASPRLSVLRHIQEESTPPPPSLSRAELQRLNRQALQGIEKYTFRGPGAHRQPPQRRSNHGRPPRPSRHRRQPSSSASPPSERGSSSTAAPSSTGSSSAPSASTEAQAACACEAHRDDSLFRTKVAEMQFEMAKLRIRMEQYRSQVHHLRSEQEAKQGRIRHLLDLKRETEDELANVLDDIDDKEAIIFGLTYEIELYSGPEWDASGMNTPRRSPFRSPGRFASRGSPSYPPGLAASAPAAGSPLGMATPAPAPHATLAVHPLFRRRGGSAASSLASSSARYRRRGGSPGSVRKVYSPARSSRPSPRSSLSRFSTS